MYMLCPGHGSLSFLPPLPYIGYARDTMVSNSQRHYLMYALPEIRSVPPPLPYMPCLISTASTIYTLCPRHDGLPLPLPLPFIPSARGTDFSHSHYPILIYAMPVQRWFLIPAAPTLHMLCPRHGRLPIPSP